MTPWAAHELTLHRGRGNETPPRRNNDLGKRPVITSLSLVTPPPPLIHTSFLSHSGSVETSRVSIKSAWQGGKKKKKYNPPSTLSAASCHHFLPTQKNQCADINTYCTHSKWCGWNTKSIFQENPSDICFSYYHNNCHSTAQSKSLEERKRI